MNEPVSRATLLIREIGTGDRQAANELLPLVYEELRRLARARLAREKPGLTLQATSLVHEAYLRLVQGEVGWEGRRHFFAAAAEAMRRILIERARKYATERHAGGLERVSLSEVPAPGQEVAPEVLLALNEALSKLEQRDEEMAQVVKLRYFAGLSVEETAQSLGVSARTVNRHWTGARAWLLRELGSAA